MTNRQRQLFKGGKEKGDILMEDRASLGDITSSSKLHQDRSTRYHRFSSNANTNIRTNTTNNNNSRSTSSATTNTFTRGDYFSCRKVVAEVASVANLVNISSDALSDRPTDQEAVCMPPQSKASLGSLVALVMFVALKL